MKSFFACLVQASVNYVVILAGRDISTCAPSIIFKGRSHTSFSVACQFEKAIIYMAIYTPSFSYIKCKQVNLYSFLGPFANDLTVYHVCKIHVLVLTSISKVCMFIAFNVPLRREKDWSGC